GWPLTMFLMPDQTPFFGGTYFPKTARHGLPAFPDMLQRVHDYYTSHRDELEQQNRSLRETLERIERTVLVDAGTLGSAPLEGAANQLLQQFDATHGGFGDAPKFPHPPSLERCLRETRRTGEEGHAAMALFTLGKMADGGLYDHLGGGFFRYSVDERWAIPHFEKMLYDNAQLLSLYAAALRHSRAPLFERILAETGAWVMREMQSDAGGFFSTLDADSDGEEGRFYLWDPEAIRAVLSDAENAVATARFGLDRPANFEGRWHLGVAADIPQIAAQLAMSEKRIVVLLSAARQKLLATREHRVRPGLDDKILTGWNGLMIRGMAAAGRALGREEFIASAQRAVDFVRRDLIRDDRLLAGTHPAATADTPTLNGYLEDHAYLLEGILELLQARWDSADLDLATTLAETLLARFEDAENGGFFMTADDHEQLIVRTKPLSDDATPAGNGVAARALGRLGCLLGEPRYLEAAERTLRGAWQPMNEAPMAFCTLLSALEEHLNPVETIILRGTAAATAPWRAVAQQNESAATRLVFSIPTDAPGLPTVLADKVAQGEVTAYRCRGTVCQEPITDLAAFRAVLEPPR
ncbi:MAG: thioredoxin domain-containing protein, partial [Pseudomonadota bacterium]|nr:thioredoxin domain-containing protein [Pseudomonadota bacterium]